MSKLDNLMKTIRAEVADECAEYNAIEADKVREQIKNRKGEYEYTPGWYVTDGYGKGDGLNAVFGHTATLVHGSWVTIFTHKLRAEQALAETRAEVIICNYLPTFDESCVVPTEKGNNTYHFFDNNGRIYIPLSCGFVICEELPESTLHRILRCRWFVLLWANIRNFFTEYL